MSTAVTYVQWMKTRQMSTAWLTYTQSKANSFILNWKSLVVCRRVLAVPLAAEESQEHCNWDLHPHLTVCPPITSLGGMQLPRCLFMKLPSFSHRAMLLDLTAKSSPMTYPSDLWNLWGARRGKTSSPSAEQHLHFQYFISYCSCNRITLSGEKGKKKKQPKHKLQQTPKLNYRFCKVV